MESIKELEAEALYQHCDPEQFTFETTADLDDLTQVIGQARAMEAVQFGIGIQQEGYNIFALGPVGTGKRSIVRQSFERRAAGEPIPSDWCYVHNFEQSHKPQALRLPPGKGMELRHDMEELVEELRTALSAAFESEEYQTRRQVIQDEILRQIPRWRREAREKLKETNREMTNFAVGGLIDELRKKYASFAKVVDYLNALQEDVIRNARDFLASEEEQGGEGQNAPGQQNAVSPMQAAARALRRYQVNVLVDHSRSKGAPVIYEDNPTYQNLIGRMEHIARMGALMTDFSLIKPGALHRANGGYLMLDARKVLLQPYAWEGLKRALSAGKVHIESIGQMLSLLSTATLEPEPIPLHVKGEQGVLIPASNVKHLMLRKDVIEAVEDGRFHIYPIETIDQGMAVLTGRPAGERNEAGTYPQGSINHRVESRLAELAKRRLALSKEDRV
jgi:predicted ATP-dependent protease